MIAAVVPVKRLSEAKSRLAPALTSPERRELALALLERAVAALSSTAAIERIGLVSPERDLGSRFRVDLIDDTGDLNGSLAAGARWADVSGAQMLLIVPGDLPLIRPDDVAAIVDLAPASPGIAIAPTWDGGTGALLLSPPHVIPPFFGPGSFARHLEAAGEAGARAVRINREAFSRDLDTLEDFQALRAHLPAAFSRVSAVE